MRILWSSEIAHEMLNRLERVQQSMQECRNQSAIARQALDEANVEGDDTALIKAMQRFEDCIARMKTFGDSLDDFVAAIRKTDGMFSDTEVEIALLADRAEIPGSSMAEMIEDNGHHIAWNPDAFAPMPSMRLNAIEVPEWLNDIADKSNLISSMEK